MGEANGGYVPAGRGWVRRERVLRDKPPGKEHALKFPATAASLLFGCGHTHFLNFDQPAIDVFPPAEPGSPRGV